MKKAISLGQLTGMKENKENEQKLPLSLIEIKELKAEEIEKKEDEGTRLLEWVCKEGHLDKIAQNELGKIKEERWFVTNEDGISPLQFALAQEPSLNLKFLEQARPIKLSKVTREITELIKKHPIKILEKLLKDTLRFNMLKQEKSVEEPKEKGKEKGKESQEKTGR